MNVGLLVIYECWLALNGFGCGHGDVWTIMNDRKGGIFLGYTNYYCLTNGYLITVIIIITVD